MFQTRVRVDVQLVLHFLDDRDLQKKLKVRFRADLFQH